MARKQKKYHYIYKTTNLLSGKYYIGMHSTDNLDDGYLGSGTRLRRSINKYGEENFKLEILEYCNSREELKGRELEIVNLDEIAKIDCMNLKVGGYGGLSNGEHREKFIEAGINNFNKTKEQRELSIAKVVKTDFFKKRVSDGLKVYYETHDGTFKGKKHSEETKEKMRKSKNVGSNNSQYGSCWITNEIENKKIKKGDLIPEGWRLGRKMK